MAAKKGLRAELWAEKGAFSVNVSDLKVKSWSVSVPGFDIVGEKAVIESFEVSLADAKRLVKMFNKAIKEAEGK